MRGIEHFNEAEKLTALAMQRAGDGEPRLPYQVRTTYLAAAQVHATLAAAFAQGAMVGRIGDVRRLLELFCDVDEPLSPPPAAHPVHRAEAAPITDEQAARCTCTHLLAAHVDDTGPCLAVCGCEVYQVALAFPTFTPAVMAS